jgi:NSS family neurotransmitter:Na+ symporter
MKITIITSLLLWIVGLGSVFSFNIWVDFTPLDMIKPLEGKTIFGLIDYFGSNLLMPIGGILMTLIAGWLISTESSKNELKLKDQRTFSFWHFLIRYVAPAAVFLLFLSNLIN